MSAVIVSNHRRGQSQSVKVSLGDTITTEHIVNSDIVPVIPDGWSIEVPQESGQLKLNSRQVVLLSLNEYLADLGDSCTLDQRFLSEDVLDTNFVDYLRTHPEFISASWKGYTIYFPATTQDFGDRYTCLNVYGIHWSDGKWNKIIRSVNSFWNDNDFVAVFRQ